MQKPTVFEVASAAGVSVATVDRVLNNRRGVRPGTVERVQAAVERLGFRRDAFAAGLATRRRERYLFLLPSAGTNSFMATLHDTVSAAAGRLAEQRVTVARAEYAAFDEVSLAERLRGIAFGSADGSVDGVALVGIDASVVRREIDRLVECGVPVVTLVSDVTPSRRERFIGIDNKAAGRVAASLIGRMAGGRIGSVAVVVGQMTLHDHADRRLGFEQVVRREYPGLELLPVIEGQDASAETEPKVAALLRQRADLVGLYSAGAGNRGIIAALRSDGREMVPTVVAHELTPHARDALLTGMFTAVLHQDQGQEVENAIAALRAAVRPGFDFERAGGPIHAQIFLRDNVP